MGCKESQKDFIDTSVVKLYGHFFFLFYIMDDMNSIDSNNATSCQDLVSSGTRKYHLLPN